mmetsp:Transcript_25692/g.55805  ORF Transcript_25692/g.55805 Transcript_25692/m.55805 type:complete len:101 (-) Transcript_25692:2-304(-)
MATKRRRPLATEARGSTPCGGGEELDSAASHLETMDALDTFDGGAVTRTMVCLQPWNAEVPAEVSRKLAVFKSIAIDMMVLMSVSTEFGLQIEGFYSKAL